jgi:hypothetical protein
VARRSTGILTANSDGERNRLIYGIQMLKT